MNNTIFLFFYNLAHQSAFFDNLVIFFAVYFPIVVVFLALVFIVMHHEVLKAEEPMKVLLEKKTELVKVFFSGITAWILAFFLKSLFALPRPFDALAGVQSLFPETGYAFPSGHATFFMALAISVYLLHKKAGFLFILFAVLIGIARIIGGVHFPLDILGGFIFGGFISFFLHQIFYNNRYNRKTNNN